ncbi:translocation/assembly module TamB domain-containing protein [Galbibacter sp. PAP.153]|uniref:translocation/assembly module TamB domain-containing protein n=1 Tax=Galbibacter sp. PAP.153 TaxID=3104623 RepID=UPI003007F6DC
MVLFIRSPWGQNIIVGKAVTYLSDKIGTKVTIDRLFITFGGNISLEGFYVEDQKGDTLVFSKDLEASLAFLPLIRGTEINIKSVNWNGLKANIKRDSAGTFNFDFITDAFSPADTASVDTTSQSPEIKLENIQLKNINALYDDQFTGIDSKINIGFLETEINIFDLEAMKFDVDALQFENANVSYVQTKPFAEKTEDTASTVLPFIKLNDFQFKNIQARYQSLPDKISTTVVIGDLAITMPKLDLSTNSLLLEEFMLSNSQIAYQSEAEITTDTLQKKKNNAFKWPEWDIKIDKIDLENNSLNYVTRSATDTVKGFNPSDIQLKKFNFLAEAISYRPSKAGMDLHTLSFTEHNGFELIKTAFQLDLTDENLSLKEIEVATGRSDFEGQFAMKYASMHQLMNNFEATRLNLQLPMLHLDLKDAYYFQPELSKNRIIDSLATKKIDGALGMTGTLDNMDIAKTNLKWGPNTAISFSGNIKNVTETDSLLLDIPAIKANTIKKDINTFFTDEELGVVLPDTLNLTGMLSGGFNAVTANALLQTSDGNIDVNAKYFDEGSIGFDMKLETENLNLAKILQNEKIGPLSINITANGSGKSLNSLDAVLESNFDSLTYAGYDLSNLKLNGEMKNGIGNIHLIFSDENLDLDMNTKMDLDSVHSKINVLLDLKGADLYKLGITKSDVRTGFKLNADIVGNPSDFTLDAAITNGITVYKNQSYNMGDINLNALAKQDSTFLEVNSKMLLAKLKANAAPDVIAEALKRQINGYWKDSIYTDSLQKKGNVALNMEVNIKQTPILSEVYLPGLEALDSISMDIAFNQRRKLLKANLNAPYIKYNESEIDSLNFTLDGAQDSLKFDFGWQKIASGSISVDETLLKGTFNNKKLLLNFNSTSNEETLAYINSEASFKNDTLQLHIDPKALILNRQSWNIPEDNLIVYANNYIDIQDFVLNNQGQRVSLSKKTSKNNKETFGALFENFRLNTILSILNPEEPVAKGIMKGNFNIEDPFADAGIQADMEIQDLEVLSVPLGRLSLDASSINYNEYNFNLALKEGNIDLDLQGAYKAAKTGAQLNMDLALNDLKMKAIEGFSSGDITNAKGSITGDIKLTGTTAEPIYKGSLNFEGIEMLVTQLNSSFSIDNESVTFDNAGFYMDNIEIKDEANNPFTLDGSIETEEITNPGFDLSLKADKFRVLNSTREDNDLFYGKVSLNTNIAIKGNLETPEITGDLKINDGSTFTFIVPESQLDITEREGVVIFVNKKNENDILTRKTEKENAIAILKGLNIDASIAVDKSSVFRIVVDERTGDNLQISGKGDFNFIMETNGRITLSGIYEVADGHYEASLYNIVKRKFDISPGSTITWNGDPYNAQLDIKAIYKVETSASALMTTQTTGQSQEVINAYRQKLPFLVYLNVDGELLTPELSFQLDMPENEQGALSGSVYSYIQELNGREEELNKQVFSLLVLNRFFPTSGSDGSAGGPASIARDNVNEVLSDQLNTFSDKIMGNSGIQLDFGLDSYTNYQSSSPQDVTELDVNASKSLFNDRLVVQVGSEVDIQGSSQRADGNAPVIGNVGLEYLITQDGRFRLRGYRKNEFESIIDGELIVTGISFIFNKEFNKFKELWERSIKEEMAKQENKEEDIKDKGGTKSEKNKKE